MSTTTVIGAAPQGAIPQIGIPDSKDIPRLIYAAPYFTQVPLAELIEPSVLEAIEGMLPSLVPPYVQSAADVAVAQQAVMLTGSTMSGPLFLSPVLPTQPSQAASMAYVDLMISTAGVPEVPAVPQGQIWARQTGQWVPVAQTEGTFLALGGGTMQGAINMSGNSIINLPAVPQLPNGAASAQWVLNQIAAQSLYQGTWNADTNFPDLTLPGVAQNDFSWIAITTNTSGVVISQPIPGLQGLTIFNGDNIIYSAIAAQFQRVHAGGLSLAEAQSLFLPFIGGQMSGPLLLNQDPVSNMEAATRQWVLAQTAFPEAPADGQLYGRNGLTQDWSAVLGLGGGILTGSLTLYANAVQPLNPVPLQQLTSTLGNYVPLAGNATVIGPITMTGASSNLTLNSNASANLQAVPLQQMIATLGTAGSTNVGRNLLHNPLFNVQQRGVGPWTVPSYMADRWQLLFNLDTPSFSIVPINDTGRSQIGDEAARVCLQAALTGNAGAASYTILLHQIENFARLAGKTITFSFWAAASVAGLKLGVNGYTYAGTGGSPSGGVHFPAAGVPVTLSTSFVRYSVTMTVPSSAGVTFGTNNDSSTALQIFYSSGATNNANAGGIGVQSGTITIWGVQLEIGTVATPLEKLDTRIDLANCQRFFEVGSTNIGSAYPTGGASAVVVGSAVFKVTKRAVPTMTQLASSSSNNVIANSFNTVSTDSCAIDATQGAAVGNFSLSLDWSASADL